MTVKPKHRARKRCEKCGEKWAYAPRRFCYVCRRPGIEARKRAVERWKREMLMRSVLKKAGVE